MASLVARQCFDIDDFFWYVRGKAEVSVRIHGTQFQEALTLDFIHHALVFHHQHKQLHLQVKSIDPMFFDSTRLKSVAATLLSTYLKREFVCSPLQEYQHGCAQSSDQQDVRPLPFFTDMSLEWRRQGFLLFHNFNTSVPLYSRHSHCPNKFCYQGHDAEESKRAAECDRSPEGH